MQSRRRFIGSLLGGGVALGACGGRARAATSQHKDAVREVPKGYAWQTTVFCQFGNPSLLAAIGVTAQRIGCDIWHGEPHSPDILAIPYFVVILDRNTMDRDGWDYYLAFRKKVKDSTPCIMLDDLGWPLDDRIETLDKNNRAHVRRILKTVNEAYREAQDWRPEDAFGKI